MLSGAKPGNGILHDEYNVRGVAHVHTYRKDNIFMQRLLLQSVEYICRAGQGIKNPSFLLKIKPFNNFYIEEAHMDKFRFVASFTQTL